MAGTSTSLFQSTGRVQAPFFGLFDRRDHFRPAFRDSKRLHRHHIQAAKKEDKATSTSRTAEVAEFAALAAAAGGHALALARCRTAAQSSPTPQTPTPGRNLSTELQTLNASTLWLTTPLLVAAAARTIAARATRRRTEASPAAGALARLHAAESALTAQQETMLTLSRQVDKLQTRTRLVSRDMRDQVKALQASTEQQGTTLLAAAIKMEQLESDVRDVESLVGAIQGLAAKQFGLLQTLATKVQPGASAAAKQQKPSSSSSSSPITSTTTTSTTSAKKNVDRSNSSSSSSGGGSGSKTTTSSKIDNNQTDEWGRAVVAAAAISAAAPAQQQQHDDRASYIGSTLLDAEDGSDPPASDDAGDPFDGNDGTGAGPELGSDGSVMFSF